MAHTTHMARIVGTVTYMATSGKQMNIPLGPCLIEAGDGHQVDIIWGAKGQNAAALPLRELKNAEDSGRVVLLD